MTPGATTGGARQGQPASRFILRSIGSLAAMTPWPLLGFLLLEGQLDRSSEGLLFLGGVTLFPLTILAIFGTVPESAVIAICAFVWLGAAIVPWVLLRRLLDSRAAVVALLALQSAFAFAQAAMAALLVIGKSV